jgi:hypothetical protein
MNNFQNLTNFFLNLNIFESEKRKINKREKRNIKEKKEKERKNEKKYKTEENRELG